MISQRVFDTQEELRKEGMDHVKLGSAFVKLENDLIEMLNKEALPRSMNKSLEADAAQLSFFDK